MNFKIISFSTLSISPWKNGGGSTREICRFPANADLENFVYRCSIAEISESSPFSQFPNHDRVIVQLTGAAITLESKALPKPKRLMIGEPFAFDGSMQIQCYIKSKSTDYNFMMRKDSGSALHQTLRATDSGAEREIQILPGASVIAFVLHGEAQFVQAKQPHALRAFDTLWIYSVVDPTNLKLKLSPNSSVLVHTIKLSTEDE